MDWQSFFFYHETKIKTTYAKFLVLCLEHGKNTVMILMILTIIKILRTIRIMEGLEKECVLGAASFRVLCDARIRGKGVTQIKWAVGVDIR